MNRVSDNVDSICRVCMLEDKDMISLFRKTCHDQDISLMIMLCAAVKVAADDGLPQSLCGSCLKRLESAYSFKQDCERSDETFRKLLNSQESSDNQMKAEIDVSENELDVSSIVKVEMSIDEHQVIELEEEQNKSISHHQYKFRNTKEKLKATRKISNRSITDFQCAVCNKVYQRHKRFWLHMKTHPNFTCFICWKRFGSSTTLQEHEEEHANQIFVCDHENCELRFTNARLFMDHRKNHHEIRDYMKCIKCGKTFSCEEKWDIHVHKHLRHKTFKCDVCKKSFAQKVSYESHLKSHAEEMKCDQCEKSYASKVKLEAHKLSHSGNGTFVCEECGKEFAQKYNLGRHIKIKHRGVKDTRKEKTHLCSYCGQRFARPVDLTVHIRTHTGQKPYKCDKCDYCCHDKKLLKSHVMVHSNSRPYKCNYCEKSFLHRSYLTIHERFHTGYRPYICSQCQKGFTNKKDLTVHERTHTGIKLFTCNICNNSFTTLHYLRVHTKKHDSP